MGTNFYLHISNKQLVHKFFTKDEYNLTDEPDLGYEIHLNKLSAGWRPLFQKHKAFSTFTELFNFYHEYIARLRILDEYNNEYTWDEYQECILDHANVEPEPVKWVYCEDPIYPYGKFLHTINCEPDEADLWTPFNHIEYGRTEREAKVRLKATDAFIGWMGEDRYSNDPDYNIDWVEGEFS